MITVRAIIPTTADHTPYGIVDYEGHVWVVAEIDTVSGMTVLERTALDPGATTVAPVEYVRVRRWAWPPAIVGVCVVFLFLALLVSVGRRLTFSDVLGAIVGFVVLVLLLDRREAREEQ